MQLKTVATICVLIIGSVVASQDEPSPTFIAKRPRIDAPQEQPSGPQVPIIAGQEDEQASGIIVSKPKGKVSKEQQSDPQGPITSQEGEPSGVIIVKSKLPKQEQPSSAKERLDKNVLLKNVDEIASLEKDIQAIEKNIRKSVFDKDIGTDKNIFEAIMAATGKSLSFLFEIASPKVLGDLAKQAKRPKVKEWAKKARQVYEKLKRYTSFENIYISNNNYNDIIELIGGITTLGIIFTRSKFLTDGVYAAILGENLHDVHFQLLLDSATSAAIRLALNSEWLAQRFVPQDSVLIQKAKARHSALEEAYKQRAESSIARQLGIAPEKDGRHPIRGVSENIASFLQSHPIENDIITEPSGRINPSILEPFKVHIKDGIPKEIMELAVSKGQAEDSKLNEEQSKQVRPYGPTLVTYIFENKLDIEQFLDRTRLYVDYETFVAFMNVYGPEIHVEPPRDKYFRVCARFQAALSNRHMANALFRVQNFYAALSLYNWIPWEKSFTEDKLRFLAKVTRFPLNAFPIDIQISGDGCLFRTRAYVICARRVKNIREAAEKGDLEYLCEHLLDGNVTEYGLQSILEHGSAIPMEAFKLILSVVSYRLFNFDHMTLVQRALVKGHNALYDQLERACLHDNLESIRTLIVNPNCTPGLRVNLFIRYPRHGMLVEGLYPNHCELILAKWMNMWAQRSAELDVVINPCLQYCAAKHKEQVKS